MLFKRKCKITFISHGATINTEENRFFDDENFPSLNENGRDEIENIAKWLDDKALKIDKIYASSATRCIQSARIISETINQEFEVLENLTNRKVGEWSGLSFEDIEQKFPNKISEFYTSPEHFVPNGAELLSEFNNKVNNQINEIIKNNTNKRLVIITHPEVIKAVIANALNIPLCNQFKIHIQTGSATQLSYFENFASLIYSGYIPN